MLNGVFANWILSFVFLDQTSFFLTFVVHGSTVRCALNYIAQKTVPSTKFSFQVKYLHLSLI